MKISSFRLNITSENPDRLKAFYGEVVALKPLPEMGEGSFDAGGAVLSIDGHSETRGRAVEPHRYLIDFLIDDLAGEQARLEAKGVEFIRKGGREHWGGIISTFLDPDGNYCQLIEYRPEPSP